MNYNSTLIGIFLIANVFKGLVFIYLNWETNKFSKQLNINISSKIN